ncbi:glycine zipper 2TM domain-containing protein [Saccharolobus islandicus]|uniref:17 kDa surface antigen n=3 Tax=Saccharolobus islandicus TaxID=43080 RepID=C4KGA5_SACI6|nr:glycine zipper 2TM domain-containing protein [Sulfolobus islandicus]ACP37788.1 17 kDa surface antigen [Sulfolobus islandicus M.14.25]ACP54982.1 17 kDa surface antigen [Sulfolobus islandicus M.16.27]ACR41619.1 17 kDa surface antigen [Sulfolobus islandicus M.16.4]
MSEYIAKYIVSKDHRRIGEINVRYTANNDDESIKIAKSVCDKLGEEDVEELIIGKIIGTITGAVIGNSLSKSDDNKFLGTIAGAIIGVLVGHVIDSAITKVIYSKKYPCIRPRPLDDLDKYVDIDRLEEIVNER